MNQSALPLNGDYSSTAGRLCVVSLAAYDEILAIDVTDDDGDDTDVPQMTQHVMQYYPGLVHNAQGQADIYFWPCTRDITCY